MFDASASVSRSLSTQIRMDLDMVFSSVQQIIDVYDREKREFPAEAQTQFSRQTRLRHFRFMEVDGNSGRLVQLGSLTSDHDVSRRFARDSEFIRTLVYGALHASSSQLRAYGENEALAMAYLTGDLDKGSRRNVVVALFQADETLGVFSELSMYSRFIISQDGEVLVGPARSGGSLLEGEDPKRLFDRVVRLRMPEGTAEIINSKAEPLLTSYSDIGLGGMRVVSLIEKSVALKAVSVMLAKSILFFIALIASTVIVSLFASTQLTSTLRELFEATRKIAKGDFSVRVKPRSKDEVGGLAESFNFMASEVSRLMSETAQKARMENELATVKTVQETLFPPAQVQFGSFHIVGHFEPASECGGDWWSYTPMGPDKVLLWIGDATGHGAPAALITSAARSAAAVIESLGEQHPAKALEIMNHAIHETSKGKILMTFFLGCLDLKSGVLTYSNASHDPPYLLRVPPDREPSKKDLEPLLEANGPRLGDQKGSRYEEAMLQLQPGDLILLYTDGVMDVQSPEGKKWGERTFLKNFIEAASSSPKVDVKMEDFRKRVASFRQDTELLDDVTLMMCQYERAS